MQNQSFDKECKVQAVKLFLEQKKSVSQAARELGIAKSTLHRWVTEYQVDDQHAFRGKGQLHPEQKEIQDIHHYRFTFRVQKMRQVMKVSRSGYYAWCQHKESRRRTRTRQLSQKIRRVFLDSRRLDGSPKIT